MTTSILGIVEKAKLVDGWMQVRELEWLAETASSRRVIVEIGSWKGRSTTALSAGPGIVYAVDHWLGSVDERPSTHAEAVRRGQAEMFEIFKKNLSEEIASGKVIPMMDESAAAARLKAIYRNAFADMVFIDAEHSYEGVKRDIEIWKPTVRSGGLLCGHDYQESAPGVKKAIEELLPEFKIARDSIWCVTV